MHMGEQTQKRHVVIGTAGHIDHGKTSLIKALTGRDLDKLDEEKRRGITIELGFAFYGEAAAFVDVPGHEKLVKTMIAGASAMSAAMLVIAADDGVMPQTREHLTVLDSLGVKRGIVVVSKADLVDDEWLDLVVEEARELLEGTSLAGSDVLAVNSLSGRGIDPLRNALDTLIESTPLPGNEDFFRLPIDRSFTIRGHGRVVTGTVWNGSIRNGEKLRLLPGDKEIRIRGLQAHEETVEQVSAGDRAALNVLTDAEPERGDVLISSGRGIVTDFLDISLTLAPNVRPLKQRARVRLHLGTAEVLGRLLLIDRELMQPGEQADVRLALEAPIVAMHGDLGVLRFYSPTDTLGGIRVLDPDPPDRKRSVTGLPERLMGLHGNVDEAILVFISSRTVLNKSDLMQILPISQSELDSVISRHVASELLIHLTASGTLVQTADWNQWSASILTTLQQYHRDQPNEPGMPAGALMQTVLGIHQRTDLGESLLNELSEAGKINESGGLVRLTGHVAELSKSDQADAERVHGFLHDAGLNPPVPSIIAEELSLAESRVRELLKALKNVGRVVILNEKLVLTLDWVQHAQQKLSELPDEFKLTEFNGAVGTSRKVGAPLLEYFDKQGVTIRDGDLRRLIKPSNESA
jgi:selenocysteine-specific elongation factor